jgi:hypothetical protein
MAYTLEGLKKLTVAQLREIARGIDNDALKGYSVMHKHELLRALSKSLNIPHEHHEVVGLNKAAIRAQIKELKNKRNEALGLHDHARLSEVRRKIHRLKRMIHKATV